MSYLKDREIWLSSVPTGNPPAGYVWVFIQNGVFVVRDSSGVDKIMASTTGTVTNATSASYVEYSNVADKPTLVSGSSQISFTGITNKPTLVSGSAQITYSGVSGKPEGIVSSSVQVKGYNVFATTGSNQFNGSQAITGSLTVTGQVVAQTLNVQQVTSSIVYSSGSNIFGNNSGNKHQFTGSLQVSGSSHYVLGNVGISTITPQTPLQILRDTTGNGTSIEESNMAFTVLSAAGQSKISIGASNAGNYGYVQVMQDATSWTNRNLVLQPRGGNVGIGTYTPLDTFTDRTVLTINGTTNGAFLNFGSSGTLNAFIQSNTSGFQIGSQANIPVEIRVNGSNALVLAASGGAATFSSTVTLTTSSQPIINLNTTSANQASAIVTTESGTPKWAFGTNLGTGDNSFNIYNYAASARYLTINSSGNVGIGADTIDSRYRLSVVGGDIYGEKPTGNMALVLKRITTDTQFEISVQETRTRLRTFSTANDRDIYFDTDAAGTNRMIISGTGYISLNNVVYGNTVNTSPRTLYIESGTGALGGISSIRASKKNIENVSNVNWLYQLNPVTFNYRKKDEEGNYTEEIHDYINYGLIAEDTAPIVDFIINYNEKEDKTKEIAGIEYPRLIIPMLKAIQELKSENDNLKSRLEVLEQS
jgi:hypothetical protein